MPNWNITNITFYSNNKNQLKEMYDKIKEIRNCKSSVKNDFGNGWLGDYVNILLAPEHDVNDYNLNCKGSITDISEFEETKFSIQQEEAWIPMIKLWLLICEKHYPDVKIAYIAEESGSGNYQKYDETNEYYPYNYNVDCYVDSYNEFEDYAKYDIGSGDYYDLKSIVYICKLKFEDLPDTEDLVILNEYFRNKFEDTGVCIYISKYEIVAPEDCK